MGRSFRSSSELLWSAMSLLDVKKEVASEGSLFSKICDSKVENRLMLASEMSLEVGSAWVRKRAVNRSGESARPPLAPPRLT
ncbi:MAG: hypothetical protein ACREBR_04185 [bacterium]